MKISTTSKFFIQFGLTIFILWGLFKIWHIDLSLIGLTEKISTDKILFLFASLIAINIAITYRWKILLDALKIDAKFVEILARIGMGNLINLLSPGGILGDFLRGIGLDKTSASQVSSMGSVCADKISGLIAALLIFLVSYSFRKDAFDLNALTTAFGLTVIICVGLASATYVVCILSKKSSHSRPEIKKMLSIFNNYISSLILFRGHKKRLLVTLIISVFLLYLNAFALWLIGQEIGVNNFNSVVMALSLSFLTTLIPVSIGGIGTREATFIIVLGAYGVKPEEAALLSVTWFCSLLFVYAIHAAWSLSHRPILLTELLTKKN
ncbi:flippase-like domain-containing protein [Burkholderiales bacterium]|nr:flippase-like domain-containing protein [Burkholderiales bacterium]